MSVTNNTTLIGRLVRDPELKYTQSGEAVVKFTLAVNRDFKNKQGEYDADFINCIAWRKQAENLANFKRKGDEIAIQGRIQTGSYEGQDGKRVYTTDVVAESIKFLGSGQQRSDQSDHAGPQQQYTQNKQSEYRQPIADDPFARPGNVDVDDSDLPF